MALTPNKRVTHSEWNTQKKQILQNEAVYAYMREVIGEKDDPATIVDPDDTSIMSYQKVGLNTMVSFIDSYYSSTHAPSKIYPSLDAPIELTSNTTAWELAVGTTPTPIIGYKETTLDNDDPVREGESGIQSLT